MRPALVVKRLSHIGPTEFSLGRYMYANRNNIRTDSRVLLQGRMQSKSFVLNCNLFKYLHSVPQHPGPNGALLVRLATRKNTYRFTFQHEFIVTWYEIIWRRFQHLDSREGSYSGILLYGIEISD